MAEVSMDTAVVASATKEGRIGAPLDEEGEWGEEDEGFPLGSETNDGEEEEMEADVDNSKSTKTSSSSSRSGSKSHHKSSSERRRKHHHRHHHSSSSGVGSSSRSERRSRRKSAAASSSSIGDVRDEPDDRDRDEARDALSSRLGQAGEEDSTVDAPRHGSSSSSRRRSDSFGDGKSGHQYDNYNNQQAPSPMKVSNNHDYHSKQKRKDSSDYAPEGGGGGSGGGGDASRSSRRKESRDSHHSSGRKREKGGDAAAATAGLENDEAEDGEILEDGELDDDDDANGEERQGDDERNKRSENEGPVPKSSRGLSDKYSKYSPADRKRSSIDYRDRWKRDADDKKRSKKLYNNENEDEDGNDDTRIRSSTSPPSGTVAALPAWGSGVSQAAAPKASPNSGSAAVGYRNKPSGQGGRYGKPGGHGGQSPPGLYDSPSYSEESEDGMMGDGYMDGDDKDYDNMRMRRAKKRGRDMLGDSRKQRGPPRKKTLMEMAMSERPVCKFYMDGKCAKGSGCQFNHDIESPRPKMEVCKYHLTVKGCHKERCLYMHENYPCKYYHTGAKCYSGDRCKFSHAPLTEETRRALALRVAAEDIVDMEDPEYRDYRNYPHRSYDEDDDRDYDQGDYNDTHEYQDVRNRPSLLGSPPRSKKIPSLFEIKVTPPGQSPQAGSVAPGGRQPGFPGEPNSVGGAGVLNNAANMGAMGGGGGGLAGNINMNQQQQQQVGLRPGLLGPGGPLPARNPNAAMLMNMQQQQQQMVRPGIGLAGVAPPFMTQGNAMNNLQQQQQRALGNTNNNNGNLPPVLNMLGSLIRDLQSGPGAVPTGNMVNMPGNMNSMAAQKGIGNMGQNNMGNMGPNNMSTMGQNNMGNMGQNNMGNMGQNNMNNMGNMGQNNMNTMGNMGQNNMGNMGQNNMNSMGNMGQNIGNMAQNNMGLMGSMPPNSMGNMVNRNTMANLGPGAQVNNGGLAMGPGSNNNNMNMTNINSMGPGLMRLPMQQAGMNTLGNIPVSGADMYGNNNNNLGGGTAFNAGGNVAPVNNPGQEVGIMDVDYRVGQQKPQGRPAGSGATSDGAEKEVGLAREEEEDSNQDLGELDKMRRQIEEQLRAEDEKAAAEADSFEEEGEAGASQSESREPSEEKTSVESSVQEDAAKANEAVVEIPAHLPRKQRELLKRIQQQEISRQREKERQEAAEKAEAEARAAQDAQAKAEVDDFYSSDEEGDDGEKKPKLTDVLKKLNQETSSAAATSSTTSAPISTTTSSVSAAAAATTTTTDVSSSSTSSTAATTTSSSAPSTFNIMQMIQAIKSKTGTGSFRDQANETQQTVNDNKNSVLASPASPPASPTDKDQTSLGLGLRLQPLTVDPPVVSARPLRPLTYSVVKLSLSQARPYSQLPAGVAISDSRYRSDPRVKWHAQYMERQLKKKASAGGIAGEVGVGEVRADSKRKASIDEDTIASPSPTQDTAQKATDPRLKKADPRLQKAGASPNSSGSSGATKAVDPRLERAANRPSDPRLAARAMDPRLNRQNSLPATAPGGFTSQMGPMPLGGVMNTMGGGGLGVNPMAGSMNSMAAGMNGAMTGNPQVNMAAMQGQMGGFRGNQMGGPGMGMNSVGPRGGPMNTMGNNSMMMAGGMNRMGSAVPGGLNMAMGGANQLGGPMNSMPMRPQLQGGIFVSGGGDMSTIGAAARAGMMNSAPPNMPGSQQPPGDVTPANFDPRLSGGPPRPPVPSSMPNDPRLKNRGMDPRDPRDMRGGADPRDPRGGSGFNNPKDPRSRDPRSSRQFMDTTDSSRDTGSPNLGDRYGGGNTGTSRLGWPAEEERTFGDPRSSSGINNPPAIPASLAQPPQSSLPPSLSLNTSSSSSSPPQTSISSNNPEKPSGVPATFDHRNDPRFKRVKRSAGPRAASMNYSSPLGGEQDGAPQTGNSPSDALNYNSYNRPKPPVARHMDRHMDTPSPTLPDTLEDFDMPETALPADMPVKDIFKSIDPTASPFC